MLRFACLWSLLAPICFACLRLDYYVRVPAATGLAIVLALAGVSWGAAVRSVGAEHIPSPLLVDMVYLASLLTFLLQL